MKTTVHLLSLLSIFILTVFFPLTSNSQVEIANWTFTGDVITPETGTGTLSLVGGVSATFAAGFMGAPDRGWNTTNYPDQGTGNKLNGIEITVSTTGLQSIQISFNIRHSNTAANTIVAQYSIDNGVTFADAETITFTPQPTGTGDTWFLRTLNLSVFEAINNQSSVKFRLVTAFDPTAVTSYLAARSTSTYGSGGTIRYDNLNISGTPIPVPALPSIRITEYAYQGANGEFIEFTNTGTSPVDMSGWSFDDDSRIAGTVSLSDFGIVQAGESVILAEASAAAFRATWNLCENVKVIGNLTTNLGRNDEINLYDNEGNLIDRLTYGDQTFPGSIRTQNISGWVSADGLSNNDAYAWTLSAVGDVEDSYASAGGDIGSPGKSKRSTVTFDPCPPMSPSIRITEYAYQGANGEFIEFTNTGTSPVDMSGWSFDDDSRIAGTVSLSDFGIVQAGESVILAEASAAAFRAAWNLCENVKVIGNLTTNLGRNDEINLYDNEGNLIDRLTYGDQTFPGSIRTQNISGWVSAAGLGNNDAFEWTLSTVGDAEDSYMSAGGDIGSPGKSKRSTVTFDPCPLVLPSIRITEYAYQGANGEFIEFTNTGTSPVDMSGWSYDDDSRIAGTVPLSAFGIVQAGESVILAEASAAAFRTAWNLCDNVKVIGNLTTNLGRNDEINLYDNDGNLHDRLTYGDQTFPGSIRTQNISGWVSASGLGNNDAYAWTLSAVGDIEDSYMSAGGDIGSPGKSKRSVVEFDPCSGVSAGPSIAINNSTSIYILSNNPGSINSPFASSGVINDPTDPLSQLGIDFIIEDENLPAESLTVTASSNNTSVVPNSNLLLSGTGNIRNLRITPAGVGFATITVSVSDGIESTLFLINYAASAASNRPDSTFWLTGIADASTGVPVGSGYVIIADDESQSLGLYNAQHSGQPINTFDFTSLLGLTDISGGIPREVDIEGSFRSGNRIFWIGSHGNGSEGQCRENRRRLFSTDITGSGESAQLSYVGRYDLLREHLVSWGNSNGYNFTSSVVCGGSGVLPTNPAGFNIEGFALAPNGSTAFIGFRAPIVPPADRQFALIAPILNFEAWFNNGSPAGAPSFGGPIELDLGGRAIRSLECNSFGCIIVAGNTNETGNFKIYTWTGNPSDAPRARNTDLTGLNPEGLVAVPDMPFTLNQANDFVLQLITDNGVADFYNNGQEAKALNENRHKKVRIDHVVLGQLEAQAPEITTESQSLTVECDGTGNEAALNQWLQENAGATASVDCGAGTWTHEVISSSSDCTKGQCTMYTFTITDECGQSASTQSEFCIIDTTAPFIVPINSDISLNASGQYAIQPEDLIDLQNSFDQCGTFTIQNIQPAILNCNQVNTQVTVQFVASDNCGNQSNHSSIISVSQGSDLPENFSGTNIGNGQGTVNYSPCNENNTFQISGTGFSAPQSDNLVSLSQTVCGNSSVIIQLSDISNLGWGGVQFRETNAANSKKAALKTQLSNRVIRQTRVATGAPQTSQQLSTGIIHRWLKIERSGNQFTGWSGTDGINWQLAFAANISMNECIEASAFIESINNGSNTTANLNYFEIITNNSSLPAQNTSASISSTTSMVVFPNPIIHDTQVQINTDIRKLPNLILNVRNLTGQLIRQYIVDNQTMVISMEDYPTGLYIMTLEEDQRILESCKLVKQ